MADLRALTILCLKLSSRFDEMTSQRQNSQSGGSEEIIYLLHVP